MMRGASTGLLVAALMCASGSAQTPQPFPKPADASKPQAPGAPVSSKPDTQGLKTVPADPPPPAAQAASGDPTEETLGMPIYPGARFIGAYDAGRGQRYYLFGVNTDFSQTVAFYRTMLKQRGELVFDV